jgi:hypothetical protein
MMTTSPFLLTLARDQYSFSAAEFGELVKAVGKFDRPQPQIYSSSPTSYPQAQKDQMRWL